MQETLTPKAFMSRLQKQQVNDVIAILDSIVNSWCIYICTNVLFLSL